VSCYAQQSRRRRHDRLCGLMCYPIHAPSADPANPLRRRLAQYLIKQRTASCRHRGTADCRRRPRPPTHRKRVDAAIDRAVLTPLVSALGTPPFRARNKHATSTNAEASLPAYLALADSARARVNGECSHTIRKITVNDQPDSHDQREKIKGRQYRMIDYACPSRRRPIRKTIMNGAIRTAQDHDRRSASNP
jgi:hypothetical protein